MLHSIAPYFKAVIAFIAPGAVLITAAVTEASAGGEVITQGEWITALCATVITAAGVYAVPNAPKPADGKHEA